MMVFTASNEVDAKLKSDILTKLKVARQFIETYYADVKRGVKKNKGTCVRVC